MSTQVSVSVTTTTTPISPTSSNGNTNPKVGTAKAINVFSNDGSFLERFYRSKKEGEEKKKQEEMLNTKKNFQDRFKRRAKRPLDSDSNSQSGSPYPYSRSPSVAASANGSMNGANGKAEESSAKKVKLDNEGKNTDPGKDTDKTKQRSRYEQEHVTVIPSNVTSQGANTAMRPKNK